MNKFFYFKVTFLSITARIFTGLFVYGLFDVNISDTQAVLRLLLKSIATGIGSGLVLGVLNMYFKIGYFPTRESA